MPDFKFEIGEAQIQNAIAVGIAESFSGEKKEAIIRDIVRAHLSVKESSYDKKTLLSKVVGQGIRKIASEALAAKVEEARPAIERTVLEVLGPGFEKSICDQLKAGLVARKVRNISVEVNLEEED